MGVGLVLGCATAPSPQKEPAAKAPAQSASVQSTSKDAVASAEDTRDPDKTLVCEDVKITGSRIPKRICRTLRQVNEERARAQQSVIDRPKVNPEMSQ